MGKVETQTLWSEHSWPAVLVSFVHMLLIKPLLHNLRSLIQPVHEQNYSPPLFVEIAQIFSHLPWCSVTWTLWWLPVLTGVWRRTSVVWEQFDRVEGELIWSQWKADKSLCGWAAKGKMEIVLNVLMDTKSKHFKMSFHHNHWSFKMETVSVVCVMLEEICLHGHEIRLSMASVLQL